MQPHESQTQLSASAHQVLWTVRRRTEIVHTILLGLKSINDVCADHGLSRRTVLRWISLYERNGLPVSAPRRATRFSASRGNE